MDSNDDIDEEETIIPNENEEIVAYVPDIDTTCTLCHAEFIDPDDLRIHLDQVHKIGSTVLRKCHFCPEAYSDLMAYAIHIRDYHITTLKCCTDCWRVFNDFDEHRKHSRKHICKIKGLWNCSQCYQRYDGPITLKQHEFEHKNSSEGVFLHEVLPFLSAVLKVKAITFLATLDTDVVYICAGCNMSTVDINSYIRHVKHKNCEVYVCHKCSNIFKQKKSLAKHVLSNCNIFGINEKKTRFCPDCNTHVNSKTYKRHKTRCRPIKCYSCDIKFDSMNDWSEHQSKEHAGMSVEVETCKFCWKRCVGSVAMQKHIDKIHKPQLHMYKYLCVYCKSVFKHPKNLFGHFLTQHKEIFPYTCRICNKTFRFRKKFTIHIKLLHKSVGFVEFDEFYHVFFTDKKSENPFVPKSIYVNEENNKLADQDEIKISESSNNVELNSDFLNVTETEGNQTEVENQEGKKLKRKRKFTKLNIKGDEIEAEDKEKPKLKCRRQTYKTHEEDDEAPMIIESSDDDEPLLVVRKRVRMQKKKASNAPPRRKKSSQINKSLLTCNICKKYCYTYQNYNHHIALHSKHELKKCIKCSKIFKSKTKLNEHIALEHSSSKLTETLKNLLEKRKTGGSLSEDLPSSEKFRRTIKKVDPESSTTAAKITAVDRKLSVQKFLENFVPEENKYEVPIETTASIKLVTGYHREPTIKMTKFKPIHYSKSQKLSMPVKFVDNFPEKVKLSVKLIEQPASIEERNDYYSDHYEEPTMDRYESIPEVAEEVMLEGTEEAPKLNQNETAHKIVIPKLPTELTDIRIAHLLPQAPFYKIVKVKDVLQNNEEKPDTKAPSSIKLADGTKFIMANPLAHLLGKEQEKVLESVKNKYYKSKNKNFPGMLAKALTMLDKPTTVRKKKKEEAIDLQEN